MSHGRISCWITLNQSIRFRSLKYVVGALFGACSLAFFFLKTMTFLSFLFSRILALRKPLHGRVESRLAVVNDHEHLVDLDLIAFIGIGETVHEQFVALFNGELTALVL